MSVSIRPESKPDGSVKELFNINDWKKKNEGYVTYSDLEDYANLSVGNTFKGTLNVFQSIGFLYNINNIPATTFSYIKNVNSDIQEQFTGVYEYLLEQLPLKRDLTNLDFNSINNVSREQITYLENLESDVQTQLDTLTANKRDITNNLFNGDVQIMSGNYGLTLKPAYNSTTAKTDNNAFSFVGNNLYFPNVNASYFNSSAGGVFGSSTQLTRIRRNLNVDSVIRVGYNDATNISGTQSNNASVDINGSIFIKNNILLNGLNLKTYIDAQDSAIQSQITNLTTLPAIINLQTSIDNLETTKADIIYVNNQIADIYNTSSGILSTIQEIRTELANDDATEVVIFNQLSQKVNITDYNTDKTATNSSISSINTKLTNYKSETDTNSVKITSDLSIDDRLIVNAINSNEIIVNKIYASEIITEKKNDVIVLVYMYYNNRTYPIIKKSGLFSDFKASLSNQDYEITIYPNTQFSVYDTNNRIICKIINTTDNFLYDQPLTIVGLLPYKFIIKKL